MICNRTLLIVLLLIIGNNLASADTIVLKTDATIVGHIIQENKETGMIVIDIVDNDKLTGIKHIYYQHEIQSIVKDGKYKDAAFKAVRICYQYGYHWGRCTMSAYFGYTCTPDEKYTIPTQCIDTPDLKKGVRAGVESVYVDFPQIPNKN